MSEKLRRNLLKYGITGALCVALAVVYCVLRDFSQLNLIQKYRTLCDAFTVPGLLAICSGVLVWSSNDGLFNGLGYCLYVTGKALIPGSRQKVLRYYDYVQSRKKKTITGCGFLFVCGGGCMGIAALFMALFYRLF